GVDFGEFAVYLFDLSRSRRWHPSTLRARATVRRVGTEASLTLAHRLDIVRRALRLLAPLQRPLPVLIRKTVAAAVTGVVEDDGAILAGGSSQGAADLLEIQGQGLCGA